MLTALEKGYWQGKYLYYRDIGLLTPGGKTRKFEVCSREKGIIVGHIQWFSNWKQYVFVPINCILESYTMKEIAAFCDAQTSKQKEHWKDYTRNFRTHYDMTNRNAKKNIPV